MSGEEEGRLKRSGNGSLSHDGVVCNLVSAIRDLHFPPKRMAMHPSLFSFYRSS